MKGADDSPMQALRDMAARARMLLRELRAELGRLNRAGISADALGHCSHRERARLVKSALAERNQGPARCC